MRTWWAVEVFLVTASCGLFGPDSARLMVTMDATSYVRVLPDGQATASFQVTNQGSTTAYVPACDYHMRPAVQRWTGTTWEDYTSDGCFAVSIMSPVPLGPGTSAIATWRWDLPGTYRIQLYYGETASATHAHAAIGAQFTIQ
jgi:hypothetical protein